ncbi:MAG: hypothetical protein HUU04_07465, partial [Verrucomicrobiae bacterium]|nr:hypothetical protein [Verrucomicrobiae bacterium]
MFLTTDRIVSGRNFVWRTAPLGFDSSSCFGSGREAVYQLLKDMEAEGHPSRILLPAFHPEGLVAPSRLAGWQMNEFLLNEWLDPDLDSLKKSLAAHRPTLAVLIHYFGLFKERHGFLDLCRENGTLVLEDFAQGWIEPAEARSLHPFSDYQLFSLPKLFPVPDGGVLQVASGRKPTPVRRWSPRHTRFVAQEFTGNICRTLALKPMPLRNCGASRGNLIGEVPMLFGALDQATPGGD